jgi:hypothetical protein
MVEISRYFQGIWIPREIHLCKEINSTEKILWAEINSLFDADKGGCYASNEYFCEFLQVKERTLQDMISKLKNLGLIELISFDGRTRVLKSITPNDKESFCRAEVQKTAPQKKQGCGKPHLSDAENRTSRGTPSVYTYNKEDNKDTAQSAKKVENDSSQTKLKLVFRAKKSDFYFCHDKGEYIGITEEDKTNWRKLYPSIDIDKEILNSVNWIKSNPSKGNKKLWRKFLTTTWFQNAEDKKFNQSARSFQKDVDRRTKNQDGSPVEVNYGF